MALEGMIAEVKLFAGNYAPQNWAFCDGKLLPISQHQALYSILGTSYGGNGTTNFQLPDLRGRTPVGAGNGPGLQTVQVGQKGGRETLTLGIPNLPSHSHTATSTTNLSISANSNDGNTKSPDGNYLSASVYQKDRSTTVPILTYTDSKGGATLNADSISGSVDVNIGNTGNGQPVPIRQPYQGMHYIICLNGTYPPRD
ncbi:phage tail protein [Fodinibius halophilus]|uniref:Phage tail protein n=1 Tax=Fodinibius halophilus TaxID=1736908 RepID=A0A6M1T477_9BACT|nr:tail fiber protein [Fodinibius halophilus]NGP90206.1 phage tail protein [Fodinibius halophilus]